MTHDELSLTQSQIGALGRALAITIASLHMAGIINGNAIAASLRLDRCGNEHADMFSDEIAELIRLTIDNAEINGLASLRPIDPQS